MRVIVLAAALLAASAGEAQQHRASHGTATRTASKPKTLKAFEFKGFEAGRLLSEVELGDCKEDEGTLLCIKYDEEIAGQKAGMFLRFYNRRMTSVTIALNDSNGLIEVSAAFQSKYGPPCSSFTEKWQSRGGVTVDNPVLIWCFATGKLTVKQYGPTLTSPLIQYWDDVQRPAAVPKVDF